MGTIDFTTSDGIHIHGEVTGAGKPLLFIHGWAMDHRVFCFQHEALSGYRVFSIDLRGYGRSVCQSDTDLSFRRMGRDIAELIAGLGMDAPVIAGWSMGVSVLLHSLDLLQPLASGFIFLNGTPCFLASDGFPHGMRPVVARRLARHVSANQRQALMGFYKLIYFAEQVDPGHRERLNPLFSSLAQTLDHRTVGITLAQLYEGDYRQVIKDITLPVLLVTGELDKICSPAASSCMAGQMKSARVEVVNNAGHMPFFTRDSEVNGIIRDYLRDIA